MFNLFTVCLLWVQIISTPPPPQAQSWSMFFVFVFELDDPSFSVFWYHGWVCILNAHLPQILWVEIKKAIKTKSWQINKCTTPPGCLWYRRRVFGSENKQTLYFLLLHDFAYTFIWPVRKNSGKLRNSCWNFTDFIMSRKIQNILIIVSCVSVKISFYM